MKIQARCNSVLGIAGLLLGLALPLAAGTASSYVGSLAPDDANKVFTVTFTLAKSGPVIIQSYGYGGSSQAPGGVNASGQAIVSGGFDPYISVFVGTGDAATFLASNDDGSCPPGAALPLCHDSGLTLVLPAGSYTVALSVFENFSFAENLGSGTLGDGFIGLGNYYDAASATTRSSNYALDVKIPAIVSNQVAVTQNGFVRNHSTGLWTATLTVTNTGASAIAGPVQVAFTNLSANATMVNETGVLLGNPYITVTTGTLAPGKSVSVPIQFSNPSNGYINFVPVTYSGMF